MVNGLPARAPGLRAGTGKQRAVPRDELHVGGVFLESRPQAAAQPRCRCWDLEGFPSGQGAGHGWPSWPPRGVGTVTAATARRVAHVSGSCVPHELAQSRDSNDVLEILFIPRFQKPGAAAGQVENNTPPTPSTRPPPPSSPNQLACQEEEQGAF